MAPSQDLSTSRCAGDRANDRKTRYSYQSSTLDPGSQVTTPAADAPLRRALLVVIIVLVVLAVACTLHWILRIVPSRTLGPNDTEPPPVSTESETALQNAYRGATRGTVQTRIALPAVTDPETDRNAESTNSATASSSTGNANTVRAESIRRLGVCAATSDLPSACASQDVSSLLTAGLRSGTTCTHAQALVGRLGCEQCQGPASTVESVSRGVTVNLVQAEQSPIPPIGVRGTIGKSLFPGTLDVIEPSPDVNTSPSLSHSHQRSRRVTLDGTSPPFEHCLATWFILVIAVGVGDLRDPEIDLSFILGAFKSAAVHLVSLLNDSHPYWGFPQLASFITLPAEIVWFAGRSNHRPSGSRAPMAPSSAPSLTGIYEGRVGGSALIPQYPSSTIYQRSLDWRDARPMNPAVLHISGAGYGLESPHTFAGLADPRRIAVPRAMSSAPRPEQPLVFDIARSIASSSPYGIRPDMPAFHAPLSPIPAPPPPRFEPMAPVQPAPIQAAPHVPPQLIVDHPGMVAADFIARPASSTGTLINEPDSLAASNISSVDYIADYLGSIHIGSPAPRSPPRSPVDPVYYAPPPPLAEPLPRAPQPFPAYMPPTPVPAAVPGNHLQPGYPLPAQPPYHPPAHPHYQYAPPQPQYAPPQPQYPYGPQWQMPAPVPAVVPAAQPGEFFDDQKGFVAMIKSVADGLKDLKLVDGNFLTWSRRVWDSLSVRELSQYIDAAVVPPHPLDEQAFRLWRFREGLVREVIVNTLDPSQYPYVEDNLSAASVWRILREIHAPLTESRASSIRSQIQSLRMPEGASIEEHMTKLKRLFTEMSMLGQPMPDGDQRHTLLTSLPPSWRQTVLNMELDPKPLAETIVGIRSVARRLELESSLRSSRPNPGATALAAQSNPPRPRNLCYDCCQPGHSIGSKSCPVSMKRIATFGSDRANNWRKEGKRDAHGDKPKPKDDATAAVSGTPATSKAAAPSKAAEASVVKVSTWSPSVPSWADEATAMTASEEDDSGFIIVDSGTSHHLVNQRAFFVNYREFGSHEQPIISGLYEDRKGFALGVGDVAIPTLSPQGIVWCLLPDAYFVPDAGRILLSTWRLMAAGGAVEWNPFGATPVRGPDSSLIGIAWPSNGVWRIPVSSETLSIEANSAMAASSVNQAVLWHRRFGHLGTSNLSKLASGSLVHGLPDSLVRLTECDECALAKATRSVFPISDSHASAPLELVHSDLSGPFPTSVGGARYWMVLLDDATRYLWVRVLKSKSQAFDAFRTWHKQVTTQTGRVLKTIRSDNGGEYLSDQWTEYLADSGIAHQTSTPYSSQQNGRAEREHRSLKERVRAMLIDAGLSVGWWAECVHTAVYIMNRSPHSALDVVPFEAWTGIRPSVSQLRVFGSKCFAVDTSGSAKALEPRSVECQFIGYDEMAKAWRLRVKGSVKVIRCRDVVFHESSSMSACPVESFPLDKLEGAFLPSSQEGEGEIVSGSETQEFDEIVPSPEPHAATQVGDDDEPTSVDLLDRPIEPDWTEKVSSLPPEVEAKLPRRSTRERRPTWKLRDGTSASVVIVPPAPSTYRQMLKDPLASDWQRSTLAEFESWKDLGVYSVVSAPKGRRCLGTKPVYVCKTNADGTIDRLKVRYVVLGNLQKEGLDYEETSSPTARPETLKLMVSIGTEKDWEIHQMDVKTAFLHAEVDREIYLRIPDGFPDSELPSNVPRDTLALRLHKAVYGLKQAGYLWMRHAMKVFIRIGFSQSAHDPCLFFKDLDNRGRVWVLVYVDDFTILASSPETMIASKALLSEAFQLKDLGEVRQILGLEIERDRKTGTTKLMQRKYVRNLLKELGLEDCKPAYSPMEAGLQLPIHGPDAGEVPLSLEDANFMRDKSYSRVLGSLNWLANGSRPDISFACSFLGQHAKLPGPLHWSALMRVVRYLRTTYDSGIVYTRGGGLQLVGYSDSDHGGDTRDFISYTGYVFTLAGGAISHKAIKQQCVSKSSAEAEYAALYECATQSVWLRRLATDFQLDTSNPFDIRMDSQSAMKMALREGFSGRTKHVSINYHYSRELVRRGDIELTWVPGAENVADICTKALPRPRFNELLALLRFGVSYNSHPYWGFPQLASFITLPAEIVWFAAFNNATHISIQHELRRLYQKAEQSPGSRLLVYLTGQGDQSGMCLFTDPVIGAGDLERWFAELYAGATQCRPTLCVVFDVCRAASLPNPGFDLDLGIVWSCSIGQLAYALDFGPELPSSCFLNSLFLAAHDALLGSTTFERALEFRLAEQGHLLWFIYRKRHGGNKPCNRCATIGPCHPPSPQEFECGRAGRDTLLALGELIMSKFPDVAHRVHAEMIGKMTCWRFLDSGSQAILSPSAGYGEPSTGNSSKPNRGSTGAISQAAVPILAVAS